jgi:hyperosmotically inducible protein
MRRTVLQSLVVTIALSSLTTFAATPDGLITSKAKLALWTTAGLRSTSVHVDTNEGVLTLYGKVQTTEQKANADKTAHEVVGVREVKNLLQVVAEPDEKRVERTDKDTRELAEKRLSGDAELKDSSITVKSVDKGVVLLTGTARTFSDHLHAVVAIDRVPGVRRVASEVKSPDAFGNDERVNELAEGAPAKDARRSTASDMRISTAVKLRLLTAAQIPSMEISVDTDEGVVTLFGMVPTQDLRTAAGAEATKVAGVAKLINQLEVVPTSQKKIVEAKDADLTRDLALAFANRPELKNVTTVVKNGTVRVSGTVASGWDVVNSLRLVRRVAGVRAVENFLKIDEKLETTQR